MTVDFDFAVMLHDTSGTTSLRETMQPLPLEIFPNPAQEYVKIKLPDMPEDRDNILLQIHDIQGKLIIEKNIPPSLPNVDLDIRTWADGVYYISLHQQNNYWVSKLVKY